jgi:hypothetical protein
MQIPIDYKIIIIIIIIINCSKAYAQINSSYKYWKHDFEKIKIGQENILDNRITL